jgi:hypothetical protein
MAFLLANWGRASVSMNEPIETVGAVIVGAPRIYTYYTADSQATVATTANYFGLVVNDLAIGDRIDVYSSLDATYVTYLITVATRPNLVTIVALSNQLVANVLFTPAQFITAFTAGLQIVPAPGANRVIVVTNATLSIVWATTQYTLGGAVRFQYGLAGGAAGTNTCATTVAAADINGATANNFQLLVGVAQAWGLNTALGNQALGLGVATQNFATGDSPIKVTVQYRIASLT